MGEVRLPGTGINLIGAYIDGQIDLECASLPDNSPMPALILEKCHIPAPILLQSALLRYLSLSHSLISELRADYIHVSGRVDISGIKAYPSGNLAGTGKTAQDICRVTMCGAFIEDGIEALNAHLVAPAKQPAYEKYSGRAAS
jgi:hypothetical protein